MKNFLRILYLAFFPNAARVEYLEAEVVYLRSLNSKLMGRILALTTGLGDDGKPLMPAAPVDLKPASNPANPYESLAQKERDIMQTLSREFDGIMAQARGYDAGGAVPKPNGAIHNAMPLPSDLSEV